MQAVRQPALALADRGCRGLGEHGGALPAPGGRRSGPSKSRWSAVYACTVVICPWRMTMASWSTSGGDPAEHPAGEYGSDAVSSTLMPPRRGAYGRGMTWGTTHRRDAGHRLDDPDRAARRHPDRRASAVARRRRAADVRAGPRLLPGRGPRPGRLGRVRPGTRLLADALRGRRPARARPCARRPRAGPGGAGDRPLAPRRGGADVRATTRSGRRAALRAGGPGGDGAPARRVRRPAAAGRRDARCAARLRRLPDLRQRGDPRAEPHACVPARRRPCRPVAALAPARRSRPRDGARGAGRPLVRAGPGLLRRGPRSPRAPRPGCGSSCSAASSSSRRTRSAAPTSSSAVWRAGRRRRSWLAPA